MRKLITASLFALALLAPSLVRAQTSRYVWTDLGYLTNCGTAATGAAINSAINCEIGSAANPGVNYLNGFNIVSLEIFYDDNAGGASTGYTFTLQQCSEGLGAGSCTDSADWSTIAADAVSSGTVTLTAATFTVVSDADSKLTYSLGIHYNRLRLGGVVGSGAPGATDTIRVKARVGYLAAF